MTKKLTKKQLGEGNYISPEIKTVEFKAEGPLCVSTFQMLKSLDWEEGQLNWFEE